MISALLSHFILLLKGRHNLNGLPSRCSLLFILIATVAMALDADVNVGLEHLPPWMAVFEGIVPFILVAWLGYRIASALLIAMLFVDSIWLAMSSVADALDVELPIALYIAAIGYIVVKNVVNWYRLGLMP